MPTSISDLSSQNSGLAPLNLAGNSTDQQVERLQQLMREAVDQACRSAAQHLDSSGAHIVLEQQQQLQNEVAQHILDLVQRFSYSTKYQNEEAVSDRGYPNGYRIRPVEAQVSALRKHFPSLGSCMEKLGRKPLLDGAEGWFVYPRWQALAPTYNEAVEKVINILGSVRRFSNRLVSRAGENFLRQSDRARTADQVLSEQQQGNDFYVVAAQFGMLHRGCSARRCRSILAGNEFCLGVFPIACMLLTHPERLSAGDALMIDCAGDQYSIHGDTTFDRVPLFDYGLSGVEYSMFYEDRSRNLWGTPTGFLYKFD